MISRGVRQVVILTAALCALCGESFAAPPTLTHLYPAGGQRGTTVTVTAAGAFDPWPATAWASGKGVSAVAGKEKGQFAVTVAADAVPGVYWLRAVTPEGASAPRPFVVGTLPELAEKEPNDDVVNALPVDAAGAVANGKLQKNGDVDCYAVTLKKGQTLVADGDANGSLRSPMDGVVQVLSADGFVLAQANDGPGLDPRLQFVAPADGRYVVRVFAFPAEPNSTIAFAGGDAYVYRLTLTAGPFVDHAFPPVAPRADPGRVALVGANLPPAASAVAIPPAAAWEDAATVFHPTAARFARVRLVDGPVLAALPTAPPSAPAFAVAGRLAKPGQIDVVPFTAKKGPAISLRVESRALGFAVTPVLRVLDATGNVVVRGEPARINTDLEQAFAPPADGTYRAEVRDLYGEGGPRAVYVLRVGRAEPDFELTVPNDRVYVAPGKPVEFAVTLTRKGGLTGDVTLRFDGVPEGITVTVTPPVAIAATKALTVKLSADKPGPAGAVRIIGVAAGRPGLERAARAPLADIGESTADLWWAVTAAPAPPPAVPKKKR